MPSQNFTKIYSAFHPSGVGKWVPAAAGKAKAGMAHSDCGWMCGWAGKTVRSLENTCHTWAHLRWWFTTKRRYIKCMHLYLLPICYVWSCSTYTQAQPTTLSSIWICNRLCASLWQLDVSIKYFVGQLKMHFFHLDCSTHRLLYVCWVQKESLTYLTYMRCSNSVKYLQGVH